MQTVSLQPREIAAWIASAAVLLLLLYLHLLPALLAGLLVFTLVNLLTPLLKNRMLWGDGPRLLAVSIIAAVVIGLIVLLGVLATSVIRENIERLPALINRMAEIIEHSRSRLPRTPSNCGAPWWNGCAAIPISSRTLAPILDAYSRKSSSGW
jgi:predicted PurR-regulated permease PerM